MSKTSTAQDVAELETAYRQAQYARMRQMASLYHSAGTMEEVFISGLPESDLAIIEPWRPVAVFAARVLHTPRRRYVGNHSKMRKLTDAQEVEIRREYQERRAAGRERLGYIYADLARKYGLHPAYVTLKVRTQPIPRQAGA